MNDKEKQKKNISGPYQRSRASLPNWTWGQKTDCNADARCYEHLDGLSKVQLLYFFAALLSHPEVSRSRLLLQLL